MSFSLHIRTDHWRDSMRKVASSTLGLVPVIKGNGYGFTLSRLAEESTLLGVSTVAVALPYEARVVREAGFQGDIILLSPISEKDIHQGALSDPRVIPTICDMTGLKILAHTYPGRKVLIELVTSMRRFGFSPEDLDSVASLASPLDIIGVTIHPPLIGDNYSDVMKLYERLPKNLRTSLWVSHLSSDEYTRLQSEIECDCHIRVGTHLWLSGDDTYRVTADVLALHTVTAGDTAGYWQHRVPGVGHIMAVSGGTSHGIALESPSSATSLKKRLTPVIKTLLGAVGYNRSPFVSSNGYRFRFADVPHMQHSLLWAPSDIHMSEGDTINAHVRMTIASFDEIIDE